MGIRRIVHSYRVNQATCLLPIFSNTSSYMVSIDRISFGYLCPAGQAQVVLQTISPGYQINAI